jgi:F-type H+-transporting ATPase subunit b
MALSILISVLSEGALIDLDITFLVQLAIFWASFTALYFLVFKPMGALFEVREKAIFGARDEARRLENEAESNEGGFEAKLREVRTSAGAERDRLRADGLALEKQLIENVRRETQALLDSSRTKLDEQAKVARAYIGTNSPSLAKQIASKLLGREVQS